MRKRSVLYKSQTELKGVLQTFNNAKLICKTNLNCVVISTRLHVNTLHGRRTFVYLSIVAALALAIGAIAVLIANVIDPAPKRIIFNAPEFIHSQIENELGCQFERALQVIMIDDLSEWLNTTNRRVLCLKKKSAGSWGIFAFEQLKAVELGE